MKKLISILLIIVSMFSCAFAVGCAQENKNIVIWAGPYWGGDNQKLLQKMVDNWNEHAVASGKPQAEIQVQQDMAGTIQTSAISGLAADLVLWDRWETVRFAKQQIFEPIDSMMSASGVDKKDFVKAALSEFEYNGQTYGLPLDLDTWGFFVNKKMYMNWAKTADPAVTAWLVNEGKTEESIGTAESKYNYPNTWDEFYDAVKGCTQRNADGSFKVAGMNTDHNFTSWLSTAGGELVKDSIVLLSSEVLTQNGEKTQKKAAEDVLKFLDKLIEQPNDTAEEKAQAVTSFSFISNNNQTDIFLNGKVAFMTNSILNGTAYYNEYKQDDFEFDFIPFPKGPDATSVNPGTHSGGLMGGYGFVMPVSGKKKAAAWEMMDWWILNDTNYHEWSKISNLVPAKYSTIELVKKDTEILDKTPYLSRALEAVDHYTVRPPVVAYTVYESNVLFPTIESYLKRTLDSKDEANNFKKFFEILEVNKDLNAIG